MVTSSAHVLQVETLDLGGAIPDHEILEAVEGSHATIVARFPKVCRPIA